MRTLISTLAGLIIFSFVAQAQDTRFSGKVFLQGAYEPTTSLMRTALVQQSSFPMQQPYGIAPWHYLGTESLAGTHPDMVDWILVDLRISPDTAIGRIAAILYADGTIRDASGDSVLRFIVPPGQYYLAIMHRSHLSAMTATKHAFQSGVGFDFSDTTLQVYGTCMIALGVENRGMIGGDVNQDRILKYSGSGNDRSPILQRILSVVGGTAINATTSGYYTEDLRMDGTVKYSGSGNDPSLIIQNLIALTGSNAINSTFTGPVPHAVFIPYFSCGDTLTDPRDGQQYPTVQIGTQCWMAKNLNVGVMVNSSVNQTNNGTIEKYCYDNDTTHCDIYGGLYQWDEVMSYTTTPGIQGICPPGWHIPSDAEWCILGSFLDSLVDCNNWGWSGTDAGGKMKETGTTYWKTPNTGATNSSGFGALGASSRGTTGTFGTLKNDAYFWSSSENSSTGSVAWRMTYINASVGRYATNKLTGVSIRCLSDNINPCTPQPDQANAGPDSLNIPDTSIVLQANQPVNGTGVWSVVTGTGGSFADPTLHNTLFTGQAGNTYTLLWTISNPCGSTSDTLILHFSWTSRYPAGYVHCDQASPTAVVDVTNPVSGKTWMDRNLGAMQVATSPVDTNAYGDLYQWGRFADGHQCRTSDTTSALSSSDQPGHGHFILAPNPPFDWRSPQNTNLWQGLSGLNNPCPTGYRLPTEAELDAERQSWADNNSNGAYGSPLKLPMGGFRRSFSPGMILSVGTSGNYWSSTLNSSSSSSLSFSGSNAYMGSNYRAYGLSVRCIQGAALPVPPDQPSPIMGLTDPCQNATGLIYNVIEEAGVSYAWSVPAGWSITNGQGTHEVTVTAGTDPGVIEVIPSNNDGTGPSQTLAVGTQSVPAQPTAISGNTNPCEGATETYSVNHLNGLSYTWTVPAGWSITTGQGTHEATVIIGSNTGEIAVILANACGSGIAQTLPLSPAFCCGTSTVTFTYNSSTVTYGTIDRGGLCWLDRNLGATRVATSVTDNLAYGDMFQWGRGDDGHQLRTSATTASLSSSDTPGHSDFIRASSSPADWRSPQNPSLWQGYSGNNNPCPPGFRIPTEPELEAERLSWPSLGSSGAFGSTLRWTTSGFRRNSDGAIINVGTGATVWSSTIISTGARNLSWTATNSGWGSNARASAMAIRCVRDSLPPCYPLPDQANAGPDSLNITGTSITLQANQPVNGTGVWSMLSGTGGSFADPSLHNTLFTGQAGNTYNLVWTISNQCGSNTDTVLIGFAASHTAIMITHSASQIITQGTVACVNGNKHTAENHYLRHFDLLTDFGISGNFNISDIEFGVESAVSGTGNSQPVSVKLYTLNGAMNFSNMTLIAQKDTVVTNRSYTLMKVPLAASSANGQILVVDIHIPNGQAFGHTFFLGSNSLGQTAPSYLASNECGVPNPLTYTSIGYDSVHLVINVYGYTSTGSKEASPSAVNVLSNSVSEAMHVVLPHAGYGTKSMSLDKPALLKPEDSQQGTMMNQFAPSSPDLQLNNNDAAPPNLR